MRFYFINLWGSKERRDHMFKLSQDLGLEFIRFEAVKPTLRSLRIGEHTLFSRKSCDRFHNFINSSDPVIRRRGIGVFGVYISHYFLHKYHDSMFPEEKYVIMEDDIKFDNSTLEKIDKISKSPEYKDWEIIRSVWAKSPQMPQIPLGKSFVMKGVHRESKYAYDASVTHTYFGGAHFSLFRNSTTIIKHLEDESLHAIDAVYSTDRVKVVCGNFGVQYNLFPTLIPKKNISK